MEGSFGLSMKWGYMILGITSWVAFAAERLGAAQLLIGTATVEITPLRPVALVGQLHTRISRGIQTPLRASAIALQSDGDAKGERQQAVLVSCDLTTIPTSILRRFRERLSVLHPDVDANRVVISATHTHTAPVTSEDFLETFISYPIPADGSVMLPSEYVDFLVEKLCQVVGEAWGGRTLGGVSWTLGFAATGENRRASYDGGEARMYGNTREAAFRRMEAGDDPGIECLFFWDRQKRLIGVGVNVVCPSQEVEEKNYIHADFWDETREYLRHGTGNPALTVVGWCGAAGDQSPHSMFRKAAEARMERIRGIHREQEIGRRIGRAVLDTLDVARADIRESVVFDHRLEQLALPRRGITEAEYNDAKSALQKYRDVKCLDATQVALRALEETIVSRFEGGPLGDLFQQPFFAEVHILRLGDVAIATNPFELFCDYGIQLKARSPALQTVVVQLANGYGMYLPTDRAVRGGSYSGKPHVSLVGPEGGQLLVDASVGWLERMFR